jgi:hypothetical protein
MKDSKNIPESWGIRPVLAGRISDAPSSFLIKHLLLFLLFAATVLLALAIVAPATGWAQTNTGAPTTSKLVADKLPAADAAVAPGHRLDQRKEDLLLQHWPARGQASNAVVPAPIPAFGWVPRSHQSSVFLDVWE